ncbi:DNA primase large subunit [Asbolus verrucosus]|uniref:DNA primase large subunit n=1 Tax=Asbolus verrucosus TaxID=1661398 RepID=A0A482WE13_ASBVE|nr:DNA primase large subunit [Asbolus verrucosus]
MDLTAHRRKLKKTVVSDALTDLYPHNLSMYSEPPSNNISLSEFEDMALERVQLFRIIEQAALKGQKAYSDEWKKCIREDLSKAGLKRFLRLMDGSCTSSELDYQARRVDHISHYILRLAYCRSEELRRWFLNRELEWFRLRFTYQSHESIKNFLQINNFIYTPITNNEKSSLREELTTSTVYYRRLPMFDDDRIDPLLVNLHHIHTGNNYYTVDEDKDAVDPAKLDSYSKKHFPLCMRHMHETLRATHHLKHQCRLNYGLFLKGIGLLYEDAMRFWRDEFTKKIDSNNFDKNYAYNVKHQYGKVGRMLNYSPYSCIKIITSSVGPGEHHGCPFRHWNPALIKQKLLEYGISTENANEIKNLVSDGHYQVACGKYFEYLHGKPPTNGINHPNQYFEESMNLEKGSSKNAKK